MARKFVKRRYGNKAGISVTISSIDSQVSDRIPCFLYFSNKDGAQYE
jgi:hypothetical protein